MLRKGWAKPCYTLVCLTVSPSGDQHSPEWSGLGRGGTGTVGIQRGCLTHLGESVRAFWRRRQMIDESEPGLVRRQKE